MSVYNLKRNDLKGALALYRAGGMSRDSVHVMLMLQDDPSELIRAMSSSGGGGGDWEDEDEDDVDDDDMDIRTDYSPDQPRSADGRFGEGGGSQPKTAEQAKAPGNVTQILAVKQEIKARKNITENVAKLQDLRKVQAENLSKQAAENVAKQNLNSRIARQLGEDRQEIARGRAAEDADLVAKARQAEMLDPGGEKYAAEARRINAEFDAHPPEPNPDARRMSDTAYELHDRRIDQIKPLGGGVNSSYLATLDDGSKVVWKPISGERQGMRTNIPSGTGHIREAAASQAAENLGVSDLVPAAVARVGEHDARVFTPNIPDPENFRNGSMQAFIEGQSLTAVEDARGEEYEFDRSQIERARVFDYVVGNSDRHSNNLVISSEEGHDDSIVLIDNGLAFPEGAPDRFIQPYNLRDADGKLLPSTHEQINHIDLPKLAQTLTRAGIGHVAIKQTLMRSLNIKAHPEKLAVPEPHVEEDDVEVEGDTWKDPEIWERVAREDLSEYSDIADEIMKGVK